jgi:hypothetical protein
VVGGWRRLYNEKFQHLYASPHIITVIKIKEDETCKLCSMHGQMTHSNSEEGYNWSLLFLMKVGLYYIWIETPDFELQISFCV